MSNAIHPEAGHHLPMFITAPGETDVLFNVMIGVVIVAVLAIGVLYFRLHALPEHLAHRTTKVQYEIVAVLGLISLFTHNHIYWIAGLLLAFVQLPDFTTPLTGMADSLARMAGRDEKPPPTVEPVPPPAPPRALRQPRPTDGQEKGATNA